MKENKMSQTADIDKILEEVRQYRTQTSSVNNIRPKTVNCSINKNHLNNTSVVYQKTKPQEKMVDISNGFVVYSEAEKSNKNQKTEITKNTKNTKDNKSTKKSKKTGAVISAVLAALVLVFTAGFCAFSFMGEFEYANNVYVNDVCIGGMNKKEAQEVLAKEERKLADKINVNVTAGEKSTTITGDDVECTFNTDEVLQQAKEYTKHNPFPIGKRKFTLAMQVSKDSLKDISEKVATDLRQDAVGAKVTQFDSSKSGADRFTFEDGKSRLEVNKEVFENQFETFISSGKISGDIEAATNSTESEFTKEYLLKNIKELSSYTTTANATGSENSNSNMKLAASMCDNSIINPGEVWSFNECTGDSTLESNGFKPANVYVNGKLTTGVGGGICQTSSTIYNASLYCGLDVEERLPHAYPSTYVPVGLDATIDYGNIDLKLKNNFDYQIFMECYMDGLEVVCKLYGLENELFDEVEVTSSVTSSSTASASRTFYKNGEKVTGDDIPAEELPSSSYINVDGSSGGSSTVSQAEPEDIPETSTESEESEPESQPQPETYFESDTEIDSEIY